MMHKILLKSLAHRSAPLISKITPSALINSRLSPLGHILMFHRVVPYLKVPRVHNHLSLEITPRHLEKIILFCRKHQFKLIGVHQIRDHLSQANPEKFVVFTFDDGYADNYIHAYPILKKHAAPFAIYLTNNFINRSAFIWWYVLEDILLKEDRIELEWNGEALNFKCSTPTLKEVAFQRIRDLIIHHFVPSRDCRVLEDFLTRYVKHPLDRTNQLALQAEQVMALAEDELVTLGVHTMNHYPLNSLSTPELDHEIMQSKLEWESLLQKEIKHFAFPYGKKHEVPTHVIEYVRDQGFETAMTTENRRIRQSDVNKLDRLPRYNVNCLVSEAVLKLQLTGIQPVVQRLFSRHPRSKAY